MRPVVILRPLTRQDIFKREIEGTAKQRPVNHHVALIVAVKEVKRDVYETAKAWAEMP
jgi:hypothetical protein